MPGAPRTTPSRRAKARLGLPQPPLPEHRKRLPDPRHRLKRNLHRPQSRLQTEIRLNKPHRIHQKTPSHGDRRSLAHALPRRHSSRWRTRRSRLQTPRGEARAGGFWRWSCKQRHYSDCLRLECTQASRNLKTCHETSGSAQESPNVD